MAGDDELRSVVQSALDQGLSPDQAKEAGRRYMTAKTPKPEASIQQTISDGAKSFGYGAARGASLGFVDRLAGLGSKIGNDWQQMVSGDYSDANKTENPYQEGRDEYMKDEDAAAKASPKANFAGQMVGGIVPSVVMSPIGAAASKAAQGAGTAVRIGAKLVQPAAEGALAGAGNTREDDLGEMAKNAGIGAGVGTVAAGASNAVVGGVKKVAGAVKNSLGRRVLNEVAEGTANTTATGRKRLDKAGTNIVNEVIDGPDADTVRNAYLGGAKKGREKLQPVIEEIGQQKDEAYAAFETAGRSEIDMPAYQARLQAQAKDALDAGDDELSDAIMAFGAKVEDVAARTGGMPLTRLRGMTTKAQRKASSVLGSLNEHDRAQVAGELEAVATEAMDETLSSAAKGDQALEAAASTIRENNKRFNALLTIDKSLKLRGYKEETGKSLLVRAANSVAAPAAIGAAGGAMTSENRLEGALEGAAVGAAARYGIPAIARTADRAITGGAVKIARGQLPFSLKVLSESARRSANPVTSGIVHDDEEERRRMRGGRP